MNPLARRYRRLRVAHDDAIFDACDADGTGGLNLAQSKYALQALGFYPEVREINETVKYLDLQLPLSRPEFRKVAGAVETSGCSRGLRAVPYALRGLHMKQLTAVKAGLLDTGWLRSYAEKFNRTHDAEIRERTEFAISPSCSLYDMDKHFVRAVTSLVESFDIELFSDFSAR